MTLFLTIEKREHPQLIFLKTYHSLQSYIVIILLVKYVSKLHCSFYFRFFEVEPFGSLIYIYNITSLFSTNIQLSRSAHLGDELLVRRPVPVPLAQQLRQSLNFTCELVPLLLPLQRLLLQERTSTTQLLVCCLHLDREQQSDD